MKTILLSFCLLAGSVAQAQLAPSKAPSAADSLLPQVTKQGVVQVPGVSRTALQNRAKTWFAAHFIDAENPLMLTNTAAGSLVGKGSTRVKWNAGAPGRSHRVWFVFTLEAQDGQYQYRLTDLPNQQDTLTLVQATHVVQKAPVVAVQPRPQKVVPKASKTSSVVKKQPAPILNPYAAAVQEQMGEIVKSLTTALATASEQDW